MRRCATLVLLLLSACASSTSSSSDGGTSDAGNADAGSAPVLKTVFMILMENKNWDSFNRSPHAPYINNTLLPMASHAEKYSNPIHVHPSEPNYLWLEAGTNFGIGDDHDPSVNHQGTTQHLVTLIENAGLEWKSYQEDIDGTTCPLTGVMNYAPKHNAPVFFDDVTDNLNPQSQRCIKHVRPYSELAADLTANTVANYNFITPNLCNDGHNDCIPGASAINAINDEVEESDTWLKNNVPAILASQAYKDGGVLFITWDESEPSDSCPTLDPQCPIGMIVLSPFAKGGGYSNKIVYDHSSTLRTVQEILGVQPMLGGAATATDLSDLFTKFP